jgi:hypothetical protein
MNSRSHRSWREPKTPFRSIGEIYLDSNLFSSEDEGAKTIGAVAIGENALEIIGNRRKVKGLLNETGKSELQKVLDKVKELYPDSQVKAVWDKHCGCSMCPCSPGYRIKVKTDRNYASKGENRFNLYIVNDNGGTRYKFIKPEDSWWIGYENVDKLQKWFSDER